jgi:hypothetical protein
LKDSKVQNSFQIVTALKLKCALTKHTTTKKEFANFQLGQYQRSQTGHELIREDMSALRMDVTTLSNMAGTLKTGDDWTAPTKITEKTFLQLKLKRCRRQRVVCYKEYSPELLKELKKTLLWRFSLL